MVFKEKSDEIIGKKVRVKKCEAAEHGDNEGCVCHLIGQVVKIKSRYKTPFAGTASYHIVGMVQRVRRAEVVLLKDQSTRMSRISARVRNALKGKKGVSASSEDDLPQATVHSVNGGLVLVDPVGAAMISAVEKLNCEQTLKNNADRVTHFKNRLSERGMSPNDAVIVILNVDDPHGGPLAEVLMPGEDWQQYRDRGEVPFARGLAMRPGIQEALASFDQDAAAKLLSVVDDVAVVVVDHGVAEIFPA